MKKTLTILLITIFSLAVLGLAVGSYLQHRQGVVRQVIVRLHAADEQAFITVDQVNQLIHSKDSIIGSPLKTILVHHIERQIASNPYVKSADIYLNITGNLMVDVYEREALLRVYNNINQSFYVDTDGNLFPISDKYSARVIPVNGYLKIPFREGKNVSDSLFRLTMLPGIYQLAQQIKERPFLEAAISQLFVNSRGEVDLIPEMGPHLIHFGNITDVGIKLDNLAAFYKQALVKEGWNKYKSINLAYTNQVICTKY